MRICNVTELCGISGQGLYREISSHTVRSVRRWTKNYIVDFVMNAHMENIRRKVGVIKETDFVADYISGDSMERRRV